MGNLVNWMDLKLYPDYERNWDDTIFRSEILKYLKKDDIILDLGAGSGIVAQMNFRGLVSRVCGIDPDLRVVNNPHLDEGQVALGEAIPYPDASFNLVFADNVLEHLTEPKTVFKEIARVLKPGGLFLVKTPNKMHYMPLIARLTPHSFHKYINKKRGREVIDTFPTHYRVNKPADIAFYATWSGLKTRQFLLIEGRPEYLRLTPITYFFGWLYEKIVNSLPVFERFRILLIAVLEKPL